MICVKSNQGTSMNFLKPALPILALTFLTIGMASAQPPAKPEAEKAQDVKKEEPKKDPKVEEYEKAVKDLKRFEGAFTLYVRKKELLLELPEANLGKLWLYQATLNTGFNSGSFQPGQAGEPINNIDAFRWERHDDQVWLVHPNTQYRWSKDDPLAAASERSFPEASLGSYKVEATHPEKKLLLVNVTNLFMGDPIQLGDVVNMGAGGQFVLDREKTGVDQVKAFPENTVVRMQMHFSSPRAAAQNPIAALLGGKSMLEDSRSVPFKISYNLWYRKEDDYRPRQADPRIGYFTTDFYDVAKFTNEDRTTRYINRWNLKKRDPNASLSEPVAPIVWYVDSSVPKDYRQAVKDGLLRWNLAFEKLGFKNAVQVKDAPEGDPNWDHADGRFNVVRWTMSPDSGYAVAQFRTDPFTGEILNAAITCDANMMSFAQQQQQRLGVPASTAIPASLSALLRSKDSADPLRVLWGEINPDREKALAYLTANGWNAFGCDRAERGLDDLRFAWGALNAAPGIKISKEEFAKEYITDVISHEAGHCMGLRHNFVASTLLTTAQLADDALIEKTNVSASVMDYVPVNIQAILKGKGHFFSPVLGSYDMWAIQYGYVPAGDVEGSGRTALAQIAAKSGEPGHAFMTDQDFMGGVFPYVVQFDNAKDPLSYSQKVIDAANRTRAFAVKNLPRPGESYAYRNSLIMGSLRTVFRQGQLAARFLGGMVGSRNHRGDTNEIPTLAPIDAATQRAAVSLIVRNCLSMDSLHVPANVLLSLNQDYLQSDQTSNFSPNTYNAPLRDEISSNQIQLFAALISASTTDRMLENQFKASGSNVYTMPEHYGVVLGAVFSEIGQGKDIAPTRRDLQRFAVQSLITQAQAPIGSVNDDVRTLASDGLRKLASKIKSQLRNSRKLDAMTQAHLKDIQEQIYRYLSRSVTSGR